jgi:hypothetical protein
MYVFIYETAGGRLRVKRDSEAFNRHKLPDPDRYAYAKAQRTSKNICFPNTKINKKLSRGTT